MKGMVFMAKLKKIWDIVSTVLVIIVVVCAVFLMGTRILGYQCYNVLTGSMVPTYNPGDLIYVKHIDDTDFSSIVDSSQLENAKQTKIQKVQAMVNNGDLAVGDPVSYMLNETTVATHRIVAIDAENHKLITQGDTNKTTEEVLYLNVLGEVSFSLPKIGYVAEFVQNPPGMYIAIGAGILLIGIVFLPDMLSKKKEVTEEKEEKEENKE